MNDEIKEILEFLKPIENRTCATLGSKKCELLLDYITNLQQENKRLKLNDREWQIKYDVLENLNNVYEISLFKEKEDYKSRCEKAIEYVENNWITYEDSKQFTTFDESLPVFIKEINDLLNILQNGSEDNEC